MGCTPSIHVSPTGVVYCRENDESPSQHSSATNHQPPPPPPLTASTTTTTTTAISKQQLSGPSVNQHGCNRLSSTNTQAWDRPHPPQVLLVFGKEDNVSEAWLSACKRQGHDVTLSRSPDDAMKSFLDHSHDLIVIDARNTKHFSAETVCKNIRASELSQFSVIVGVVKRSFADREAATVIPMLHTGFNRIVTESSTVGGVLNDLIQIEQSELSSQSQLRAVQAVFTALDACKEMIHITDTQHKIQYINRTCENILGYALDDVMGQSLWELHSADNHKQDVRVIDNRPSVDFKPSFDQHQRSTAIDHRSFADHRQPSENKSGESRVNLDISEAVNMQMRRGREWEGIVTCRRKSGDTIHLPSKVIPVAPCARKNEYFVYSSDTHALDRLEFPGSTDHFHPRGSIKSLRKGSYDIRSLNSDGGTVETDHPGRVLSAPVERERFTFNRNVTFETFNFLEGTQNMMRRQSLVKLNSLTIEAPITRVFNIITAAQENSPAYVAQALEKVLDILRSTELYSPQLISAASDNNKQVPADPVATDLLGGLLAQAPKPLMSGRRSSNDTNIKVSQLPRPSLPMLQQQASAAIRELVAEDMSWNFDVIKLEKISDKRPLVWLGMSLMSRFNVPNTLGCDEQTLQNWLTLIEANYHADITYHNSTHAADVLQATAYFLDLERIKRLLDPLDVAACLIAAVVHDVDHPGKNSAFLCNTDNELAILYNDLSVLESHHAAVSFKYTHSDDRVNIYKALDRDTYKHVRKSIIDMVLATDMTKHFEHLSKFVNMSASSKVAMKDEETASLDGSRDSPDLMSFGSPENLVIIKRMLIKCADVSNPVRPLPLSIDWAHRIANEYFSQTEEEKRRSLPIVMPQFDRTTCSIPKSQIGFIDFFVNDMFDAWDALADVPELMEHLRINYQYWKEQEDAAKNNPSQPQTLSTATEEEEEEEEEEVKEEEKSGEEEKISNEQDGNVRTKLIGKEVTAS
ncbi:high affinity cAMP-specific and IBMX-insensitive 3',5'-cyclic phosphodiesterase 8B-like isoform X2 [Palaemon carinicauda]|uniref:high affinity cAMP-specific and IBMX-insensitive 3',5'-cyclic phosphodiesterase 8B-like isoform X2 n=1 Tax=Palaemon carinicauda TaxID=392227 RepID=UPI0035B5752A